MPRVKTLKSRVRMTPSRVKTSPSTTTRGRGRGGRPWRRTRALIFKRDQYRCRKHYEEHGKLVPLLLHSDDKTKVGYVDHNIPLSQGGDDSERNLWLMCKECHDQKTQEESQGIQQEYRDMGLVSDEYTIT